MPIIRPRRNHETNQIDYGYDDAIENEINSKPTFATVTAVASPFQ